jgi:hypothetical protein
MQVSFNHYLCSTGLNLKQLQDPGSPLNHGHHITFTGGCARSPRTFLTAFLSHEQSAVQNHTVMTANISFANTTNLKYFRTNKSTLPYRQGYFVLSFAK